MINHLRINGLFFNQNQNRFAAFRGIKQSLVLLFGMLFSVMSVQAQCEAIDVPYTQNFEAAAIPAFPACTSIQNAGSGNNWNVSNVANQFGFTGKFLRYNYNVNNNANAWFYTRAINLTAGTSYRIMYNYGANTNFTEKLKVAYGIAADAASMINILADHPNVNHANTSNTVYFTPDVSGVYYFGFNAYSNLNQEYLYVDDIKIDLTPSCIYPTAVTVSSIAQTTATISWTASLTATPGGYEYEIRTSGAPGSGITGLVTSGTTASNGLTKNIAGLSANTAYNLYVRSNCGSGDFSEWTPVKAFTTLCNTESAPTAVQTFSNYAGVIPAECWSEATGVLDVNSILANANSKWLSSAGFANAGADKGAKINIYDNRKDWIISNPINLGTGNVFRVKYDMAVTGYNNTQLQSTLGTHKVQLVVSTDAGITWSNTNVIKTYTGAGTYSNTGQTEYVNLTGYSGTVKLAFVATASSIATDVDFHIDNFVIESVPAPAITDFTSTVNCGPSTLLTVNGTNLVNAAVTIGGNPVVLVANSNGQIRAMISSNMTGSVVVTTAGGVATSATEFTFAAASDLTLSNTSAAICEGAVSTVALTGGATDYTTFSWTPSTGVTGNETDGWIFNPAVTTAYVLNASNASGCTNNTTFHVQVTPLPNPLTVADATLELCQNGTSAVASANATLTTTEAHTANFTFGSDIELTDQLSLNATVTLPANATVISTRLVFTDVSSEEAYGSDLDASLSGAVALDPTVIAEINDELFNEGPFEITTDNVPNAGGAVTLTLVNNYEGLATFGNIALVVEYTLPVQADITWWGALTSGAQIGTGTSLEIVGTSVLPTTATPGNYTVYAQASNGVCGNARIPVTVTVNANPTPVITAPSLAVCAGEEVVLSSSVASGNTWSTTAVTNTITVSEAGSYTVTVTDLNGCSGTSAPVVVIVNAVPLAAASLTGDVTITATPAGQVYQWINCATNTPVSGATSEVFTATENGTYKVIVTNASGCKDTSDCVNVSKVGLSENSMHLGVSLYPNPTEGNVHVAMTANEQANVTVFDAQGKVVLTMSDVENGAVIDINHAQKGIYLVQISNAKGSEIFRIVKK